MKAKFDQTETMTPDEKFSAVANLSQALEDNFISLGQLLSDIKRTKLFKFKGYESFKDFIEAEYKMSGSLQGNWCRLLTSSSKRWTWTKTLSKTSASTASR